ncbi:MAG: hypothetical protein M1820_005293 [Bogoriella megaspora]|nr:MAG: hypothetical protein M1820_005293 [Bogoriella megaspora]
MGDDESPPTGEGKRGVSRFLTKRWKGRHPSNEEPQEKPAQQNFALNDDVTDFLKPSTSKASQNSKLYPQIDVAVAQRWPGATEIGNQDIVKTSTIPGGLKSKGRRKDGLVVAFVRTAPEVIGEGGDETETPSIEISKRRVREQQAKAKVQSPKERHASRDDSALQSTTPALSRGLTRAAEVRTQRKSQDFSEGAALRRSRTIGSATSPPIQSASSRFQAPAPMAAHPTHAPEPIDPGFRPNPLQRTQTGLQTDLDLSDDDSAPHSALSVQETPISAETPPKDRFPIPNRPPDLSSPIQPHEELDRFMQSQPSHMPTREAQRQDDMLAEEGQALHNAARGEMPMPVLDYSSPAVIGASPRPSEDSIAPPPSVGSSNSGYAQELSAPATRQSLSNSPAMPVPSSYGKPQPARGPPVRPSPRYDDSPQSTRSADTMYSQTLAPSPQAAQRPGQPPIENVPAPPPHAIRTDAPRLPVFENNSSTDDFMQQIMNQVGGQRPPSQERQYQEGAFQSFPQQNPVYDSQLPREHQHQPQPQHQQQKFREPIYTQPIQAATHTQESPYQPFTPEDAPSQSLPFRQENPPRPKPSAIDVAPPRIPQLAQDEITPKAIPRSQPDADYLPQLAYGQTMPQQNAMQDSVGLDSPYSETKARPLHRRDGSSPSRTSYPSRQSPTRARQSPTRGLGQQPESSPTRRPVQACQPSLEQRQSTSSSEQSLQQLPIRKQSPVRRPVMQIDPPSARLRGPSIDQSPTRRQPQPSPGFGLGPQADAALEEFATRVVHMKGIFRLTAQKDKANQASLLEWLRTSIWWFLKGKAGLEELIRSRPRNVDPSDPQWREQLSQPHVDLAKCWWIVTEVIPSHPDWAGEEEPRSAVTTSSRGSTRASETERAFDTREHVITNLKALMMSMSRNNVMPPSASLIQGQDTMIWIPYPSFSMDVKACLSATRSKSILVDSTEQKEVYNLTSVIPLADTPTDFYYGRMFVNASISSDDQNSEPIPFACVVSLIRDRTDYQIKMLICTQSEMANLCVQPDRKLAPSWNDVHWRPKHNAIDVTLSRSYMLNLDFSERDFKTIWNIYDYTTKLEAQLQPLPDSQERFAYEVTLRDFQLTDPTNSYGFPPERIPRCRARVFKKISIKREPTGDRKIHKGYRLLVVTSPKTKTLRSMTYEIVQQVLINFEFQNDGDVNAKGAPVLLLRLPRADKLVTAFLSFNDANERNTLYYILNGMSVTSHEDIVARLKLDNISVQRAKHGGSQQELVVIDPLRDLQWKDLVVINRRAEEEGEFMKTVGSESLRIVARHGAGALTDRCNFGTLITFFFTITPQKLEFRNYLCLLIYLKGPGELHIRLPCTPANALSSSISSNSSSTPPFPGNSSPDPSQPPTSPLVLPASITLLRAPATSLTSSVDPRATTPGIPSGMANMLQTAFTTPTTRTFTFPALSSLHKFQEVLTGNRVRFDGVAEKVSISRKRTGSAIPGLTKKSLEARSVRVQIVRSLSGSEYGGAPTTQICLFFEGFAAAEAMNFVLRPTDAYERVDGKFHKEKDRERDREREREREVSRESSPAVAGDGRFGIRLVDAKFSLPNPEAEEAGGGKAREREREKESSRWRMSRSGAHGVEGRFDANGNVDGEEVGKRAQELGLNALGGGAREAEVLRRRFVCLDELEFADMHDDVVVGFGSESGMLFILPWLHF